MKVGVVLPMFSGDIGRVLSFAVRAEELGYDGVFAFDHFFPPGGRPDQPALEPFATLGAVAAATRAVSLGTLVARARLRPAGLLAKMAASLDHISEGRMILGIGTGDPLDQPEHEAFGFPTLSVSSRRKHLIETIAAVKALFRAETWPGGELVPPVSGPLVPPPFTPGGPPVWIGGQGDRVVRLAGAVADAWNGWGFDVERFSAKMRLLSEGGTWGRRAEATWAGIVLAGSDDEEAQSLREARKAKGVSDEGIWVGGTELLATFVNGLARAGATWAVMVPAGPRDRLDLIARTVLPLVRTAPLEPVDSQPGS